MHGSYELNKPQRHSYSHAFVYSAFEQYLKSVVLGAVVVVVAIVCVLCALLPHVRGLVCVVCTIICIDVLLTSKIEIRL